MPSTIKFPFSGDEALPRIPITLSYTKASDVPLILGQTNFFREFDVCFQRSQRMIEIIRF
jgi:hypothetical protein